MLKIKKLINDPLKGVFELLDGLVVAYDQDARKVGRGYTVMNQLKPVQAALFVAGGSGYEPIYHCLVRKNLASGAAFGDVSAAPSPDIVLEKAQSVSRVNRLPLPYKNEAEGMVNFDTGNGLVREKGMTVEALLIDDGMVSVRPERKTDRRGIGWLVPIFKLDDTPAVVAVLRDFGIKVYDTLVGLYVTCQEMAGLSISLNKRDEELKGYWDMPFSFLHFTKI